MKWIIIAAVMAVILVGLAFVGPIMSDVETPNYKVVKSSGDVEIREYEPMIIAKVQVNGERKEAISHGFRLLADYIFGNNIVKQEIAMTAPVQQQESTQIAMTAPVEQQSTGTAWQVSFVMPSHYTMETLPKPANERVTLMEIPAKRFVVIRFSGTNTDKNLQAHEEKLMEYIKANHLSIAGTPKYAFYNPPWTLPFLRRNEVMIEIATE